MSVRRQVHSYSLIHPLLGSCFFWSTFSMCLDLLSLGYFGPLLRPVLGCVLGTVSLGLSSATACSGCPFVSGVLLPLCFPCDSFFGVLRGLFLLLLLFGVSCLVTLLVFALIGVVAVGPALFWLCLLPFHPPELVL